MSRAAALGRAAGRLFVVSSTATVLIFLALVAGEVVAARVADFGEAGGTAGGPGVAAGLGAVAILTDDGRLCSGVLVGDRAVLSAAHCFVGVSGVMARVVFGDRAGEVAASMSRRGARVHRRGGGEAFDGADLAVVELLADAPREWRRVGVARSARSLFGWHALVGYGYADAFDRFSGAPDESGALKVMHVHSLPTPIPFGVSSVRIASPHPCFGDSGGPLLRMVGGEPVVVGVLSSISVSSASACSNATISSALAGDNLRWLGRTLSEIGRKKNNERRGSNRVE